MIWYTIPQAAERVHRDPETIRRWLREERLTFHRSDIDGQRYVTETELLQVEMHLRNRQRETRISTAIAS